MDGVFPSTILRSEAKTAMGTRRRALLDPFLIELKSPYNVIGLACVIRPQALFIIRPSGIFISERGSIIRPLVYN